ncbi:dTDP-4-dehydrorhamnose 3,5-epimerase [candidate division WOR-1 bacterium RIFOXYA12_FULL_52_29]|uniref:dTDP-4-dehydrorhamnose 3,5-epimerase n=1 Tax=candidate division WOR-1 bacterium RIFOXYC12_FULL_54_18 TaxID=1802584 RepID=A0A1F4T8A6_UNCSA|nr:MAG: dTDP-4-dehydrorhamnose 3,5-epimerase [candidate division WOR-1 bacterium RIFOXYA2_FULL_51_19]OGC18390.1 MAG: dTDP-4-dehydrorhamnose 3,5-epimerase [candidate division WOR-1 bacterium RIFOXYA12_FULL_52_29]OGC27245.1 MAG: dTDP-4-dehydrorhamnose 3,5-epimerase [candidate division WOR-1 bacterium RIFOXYB2_FULL_45_9]OGC28807.1 MAG: dTDP-4-dehydrorhamnose 3,5-epimerase [candidate division WOR-1 bacterium RIFOXYC12_FULL_54_18]OGC30739.1 MAG: dTDP-4-dehydrorhamnose 3,5-epimerase [candidate divisi
MINFKFSKTPLAGVVVIESRSFTDNRGFFMETYHSRTFAENGLIAQFVQDNHSRSKKGVVRGLHYQIPPHPQGKLVSVMKGLIFDVAVDLRKSSATFGKWHGELLDVTKQLYIPEGFAHGFLALEDETDVLYKCTDLYDPAGERAIVWNDPDLKIMWPLKGLTPLVSDKDAKSPAFKAAETFN